MARIRGVFEYCTYEVKNNYWKPITEGKVEHSCNKTSALYNRISSKDGIIGKPVTAREICEFKITLRQSGTLLFMRGFCVLVNH